MDLAPRFGKITNPGVTKWVCDSCGHEDTDSTIKREAEPVYTQEEEQLIKERLRKLGYME